MNEVNQEIDLPNNQIVLTGNLLMFLKLVNIGLIDTLVHSVSFMKHSVETILIWLFIHSKYNDIISQYLLHTSCHLIALKIFLNIKN